MSSPSPFDASRASEQATKPHPELGRGLNHTGKPLEAQAADWAEATVWSLAIFALLMIGAYFVSHLIAGAITL